MKTQISYLYCDVSNYKFRGSISVDGALKLSELKAYLFDGRFFIPHEVGMEHLLNMPMNQDDHYLHTFTGFQNTDGGETLCTSEELVTRFKKANDLGWFSSFK